MFTQLLDNITVPGSADGTLPEIIGLQVKGVKSIFEVTSSTASTTMATFSDGKPALVKTKVGTGFAFYAGFMPGLSYFATAIPLRPVDRSSVDEGMDHFIPTDFTTAARDRVIWLPLAGRESDPTVVPVRASNPLVEVGQIQAPEGVATALPCVNWAGEMVTLSHYSIVSDG
jgi:hypothetical protein